MTTHGLRRTFNNLSRQVAGEIVTRSITGHVTQEMTEHYSHVDRSEKLAAVGKVVRLVGLPSGEVGDQVGDRRSYCLADPHPVPLPDLRQGEGTDGQRSP